jgi:hypothetical protein
MHMIKRIGLVALTGLVCAWPIGMLVAARMSGPLWYLAAFSLTFSAGVAVFAIATGIVILVAKRSASHGGIRAAITTTAVVSVVSALASLSVL